MEYFRIRYTGDRKVLGNYPQVKEVKYKCHIYDEPRFIQHIKYQKIDFEPIVATPVLYVKSKRTDLIEHLGIGFSHRILVSSRFKDILEKSNGEDFQFFKCPIFHDGNEYKDYCIVNPINTKLDYIDFQKSNIMIRRRDDEGGTKTDKIEISNIEDFYSTQKFYRRSNERIFIEKISFNKNLKSDFFTVRSVEGGIGYYVSETLKLEIEKKGFTGMEFPPAHYSYQDWVSTLKKE